MHCTITPNLYYPHILLTNLIFRSETERPEVLGAQYVELCNDFPYNPTSQLLSIISSSAKAVSASTLLGNGLASVKIADFIECRF